MLRRDPTEAPAKQPKVFLAEVSDDLYKPRKKLLGALEQAGAEVFQKAPYPQTAVEYEQALGRDLGGCSLFVQLLSDLPGRELHGSTKTIVTAQLELAKSLNKTILQWRDRDLDLNEVEEDSQRQILEGPSVMAITLEELQYEVLQKAFPKPARESHAPLPTGDALVFVHSDAIDQALVKEICVVLDREQIGWVVPSETESPDRVRHEFEDLLLGCDALMLIYGQSPGGWVRQQLIDPTAVTNKGWNGVCWNGAIDGQALAVMRACDRAVERAGDDDLHLFRDSRGLARALTGNTQGAIEDFEFFIRHTNNAEQKSQRQAWVGALGAGKNPFTPEVLQSLRGQ